MALFMVRGGKYGEHEERFFKENRVYLTWDEMPSQALATAQTAEQVRSALRNHYTGESEGVIGNWTGQLGTFLLRMKKGDWVVTPRKSQPIIAIGEITGELGFDPNGDDRFQFYFPVKWLNTNIPRSIFDQDILYSFGAFMTVCEIKRNDAERRVRALAKSQWTPDKRLPIHPAGDTGEVPEERVDLERFARDEITKRIIAKFAGHGMARLVESVLRAQGFTTYRSPEGSDKGIDILASAGPLGFGEQRICVQVKSGDTPVDHPTLSQLLGAMHNVGANQGLLVSWAGFRSSVNKEIPNQFFRVRLWDQGDIIEQLLLHYDKLDKEIQAELPLKRIWVLVAEE